MAVIRNKEMRIPVQRTQDKDRIIRVGRPGLAIKVNNLHKFECTYNKAKISLDPLTWMMKKLELFRVLQQYVLTNQAYVPGNDTMHD